MNVPLSPQLQLEVRRAGNPQAPKIVFLHAFPLNHAMWDAQIAHFQDLYDCIAPNFRGFGDSTPFEVKPTFEAMARDIKTLLDALQIEEKVVICGLSMGGYCAFEFWRAFPDAVRALVLCDTRADADSSEARESRNEMLGFALRNDSRAVAQKMLPKLLGKSNANREDWAFEIEEMAARSRHENLAATIQALRDRRDSTPILGEIAVPTLVICGEEDEISTPQTMQEMAAKIPNAQFALIEGAGHLSNIENPARFDEVLEGFLGAQSF